MAGCQYNFSDNAGSRKGDKVGDTRRFNCKMAV